MQTSIRFRIWTSTNQGKKCHQLSTKQLIWNLFLSQNPEPTGIILTGDVHTHTRIFFMNDNDHAHKITKFMTMSPLKSTWQSALNRLTLVRHHHHQVGLFDPIPLCVDQYQSHFNGLLLITWKWSARVMCCGKWNYNSVRDVINKQNKNLCKRITNDNHNLRNEMIFITWFETLLFINSATINDTAGWQSNECKGNRSSKTYCA